MSLYSKASLMFVFITSRQNWVQEFFKIDVMSLHDGVLILEDFNIYAHWPTICFTTDFIYLVESSYLVQFMKGPTHNKGYTFHQGPHL